LAQPPEEGKEAPAQSQLRLDDAAELLGWSPLYLRRLIAAGEIQPGTAKGTVLWRDVRRLAERSQRMPLLTTEDQLMMEDPPVWAAIDDAERGEAATFEVDRIVQGNCLDWMRRMPRDFVQTVVTSPPYWGVRRYPDDQETAWSDGTTVAFGQEKNPEEYVRHSLEILRHLHRVVCDDGVVWWNIGDAYMTRAYVRTASNERLDAIEGRHKVSWKDYPVRRYSAGHPYLKDKDLALIPFQVALGAQRLGWWVRSVIIWSKRNTMPEPVKDRPTTAHEYILMLTKSRLYTYNASGRTEKAMSDWTHPDAQNGHSYSNGSGNGRRNQRSFWDFNSTEYDIWVANTSTGDRDHAAPFPLDVPLRCIASSTTKPGDIVFDPFAGSGTTLVAARRLGRRYFGCEIAPTYITQAADWLAHPLLDLPISLEQQLPLFSDLDGLQEVEASDLEDLPPDELTSSELGDVV